VILNVEGWLREILESNQCGRFVDPTQPSDLADALEFLAKNKKQCHLMGKNARIVAERDFSREKLAAKLEKVFLKTIGQ
jgi:glycosyltransferase involved in cell wall biosynthesis